MHVRSPFPVDVHLVRHAESEANAHGNIIGMVDAKLTPAGERQAAELAAFFVRQGFRPGVLHVSTMPRARATAEPLLPAFGFENYQVRYDLRLREIDRGDWEGQPRDQVYGPSLQAEMDRLDMDHRAPNGESMNDVAARMHRWLDETVERAVADALPSVVAVSHGVAIKCLLQRVLGSDPKRTWRIRIDNTSITTVRCSPYGWDLVRTNATPHFPLNL